LKKHKKNKKNTLLTNLIVVTITILICLLFLEVFIRIAIPQMEYSWVIFDENLYYRNSPNAYSYLDKDDFKFEVNINEKGLRDDLVPYNPESGRKRVLALGDSNTFGYGVNQSQSYSEVLERNLNEEGYPYDVINTGHGGWGTEQQLYFLMTEGKRYEPEIVTLGFYVPNDIWESDVRFNIYKVINDSLVKSPPIKQSLGRNKIRHILGSYCQTCIFIHKSISNMMTRNQRRKSDINVTENDFVYDYIYYSSRYPTVMTDEEPNSSKRAWKKSLMLLDEVNRYSLEQNITFILLIIPFREQVVDSYFEKNIMDKYDLDDDELNNPKRFLAQQRLVSWAQNNDVKHLNVLLYFRDEDINNTFYFRGDTHLNSKGHERIGDLLYNKIEAEILK